jgi:long-chain acyl-CoA synthetase
VIVPHAELIQKIAGAQGATPDLAELQEHPELMKAVGAAVSRVNAELSPIERVRRFILAREPFTTANGQMTPTLKIKRHAIRQAYGEALVRLYETKAA